MGIRSLLVNILVFIAATLGALLLAEGISRVAMPQWAPEHAERAFWAYDSLLGWSQRPNQDTRFVHRDFSVRITTNADGLRDRDHSVARVPGRRRLLVLGDSFAWGFGVEREQMFSKVIEARHPDWEVINAGVSGYGTDQEYLYLKERGARYRPDVVLLLSVPNDIEDNSRADRYWHRKPLFVVSGDSLRLTDVPVPRPSFRDRLKNALYGDTYFFAHAYVAATVALRSLTHADQPTGPWRGTLQYAVTQRLLFALDREARAIGARLVLVSVPTRDRNLQGLLAATADSVGVPYLPLDSAFAAIGERAHFAHDGHWNAAGHQVAAAAIESLLVARRIF